jgi:SAM-dependent methyltransferase
MDRKAYAQMADIQFKHWWFEGRRRILQSVLSGLALPADAQILEVGCGAGANLEMLGTVGTVYAFEPDAEMREKAEKILNKEILSGFLPHDFPYTEQFDLVGAFDVIEHIQQDSESIKALYGVTRKDGFAVFTVPAFQFMWSGHDEVNHHVRRYSRPQFKRILEDAGYRVEYISYYNTFLFPAAFCVRMLHKLMRKREETDLKISKYPFVNTLLAEIFALEKHFMKYMSFPFGLSIVAVCRK